MASKAVSTPPAVLNAPRDGSNLGAVIAAYMRSHGIETHAQMASVLGVDRTLVSKYVNGTRYCHDVVQLRRFAEAMDLPAETFGLLASPPDVTVNGDPASEESNRWRVVRQALNRNRSLLTSLAAGVYWGPQRVGATSCITRPEWTPAAPLPLESVKLTWEPDARLRRQ